MLGYKITLATTIHYSPFVMILFEFVYHGILVLWVNINLDPMLVMSKLITKLGLLITQKYHGSVGPFHSLIIHIRPIFLCIGSVYNVLFILFSGWRKCHKKIPTESAWAWWIFTGELILSEQTLCGFWTLSRILTWTLGLMQHLRWEVGYLLSLLVHAQTVDGLQMNAS